MWQGIHQDQGQGRKDWRATPGTFLQYLSITVLSSLRKVLEENGLYSSPDSGILLSEGKPGVLSRIIT